MEPMVRYSVVKDHRGTRGYGGSATGRAAFPTVENMVSYQEADVNKNRDAKGDGGSWPV